MTVHIATATVVKVSIGAAGTNSVAAFIRRGEVLPEGVDSAQLTRLLAQGFIAEVEEVEAEDATPVVTQADVDAAAALLAEEAQKVAEAKAELDKERQALDAEKAEFEKARNAAKASTPAAKSTGAKQS